MELLRREAYARVGLVGNPSDGYHGKTLSLLVRNFKARVVLYEWEDVEIVLADEDRSRFRSLGELVRDVDLHGYYGGIRLVKATIKRFVEYCQDRHDLHDRNFSIRYDTNIPRAVGLAGSSAIIVATMRALMDFYGVEISPQILPSLVLSVETEELGIAAGLQDRVIQVYGGLVYMDFSLDHAVELDGLMCGRYESLDPAELPPLFVAYSSDAAEPTEVLHGDLRTRYEQGDQEVREAILEFAELAEEARNALVGHKPERIGPLMDRNFDLRAGICGLHPEHLRMVQTARSVGATAKFAGSGGAIVGTYEDEEMFGRLRTALEAIGCCVVKPIVQ